MVSSAVILSDVFFFSIFANKSRSSGRSFLYYYPVRPILSDLYFERTSL